MKNALCSFFRGPVTNKEPQGVYSFMQLYQYITSSPQLEAVTNEVRKELGQKEAFKKKKLSLLPYVSPGGVFTRCCKSGLLFPSGDFVVDIDGLSSAEEACRLRDAVAQDERLMPDLVFVSPSTRGVKIFLPYRIDAEQTLDECLRTAIEGAWLYLEAMYQIKADRANTDICRGCLLCHDADAKYYQAPTSATRHPKL